MIGAQFILIANLAATYSAVVGALQLNVTAISADSNGHATLECWQLDNSPFSNTPDGALGFLGNASNLTYVITPPGVDTGVHTPPYNQWVIVLSGLAVVTVPGDNSSTAYLTGGASGLIFGGDTVDITVDGHQTRYPGVTETIEIAIPTGEKEAPAHTVLQKRPCDANQVAGIRDFAVEGYVEISKM